MQLMQHNALVARKTLREKHTKTHTHGRCTSQQLQQSQVMKQKQLIGEGVLTCLRGDSDHCILWSADS